MGCSLDLTAWHALQYMIQCKFAEAAKHAGRLVDTHTVILVRTSAWNCFVTAVQYRAHRACGGLVQPGRSCSGWRCLQCFPV